MSLFYRKTKKPTHKIDVKQKKKKFITWLLTLFIYLFIWNKQKIKKSVVDRSVGTYNKYKKQRRNIKNKIKKKWKRFDQLYIEIVFLKP